VVAETGNGLEAVSLAGAAARRGSCSTSACHAERPRGCEADREEGPGGPVLMLSMHADEVHITKAVEAGAVAIS